MVARAALTGQHDHRGQGAFLRRAAETALFARLAKRRLHDDDVRALEDIGQQIGSEVPDVHHLARSDRRGLGRKGEITPAAALSRASFARRSARNRAVFSS